MYVAYHSNLEAGHDETAALLGMLGSVRQFLHHAEDLDGRPGVPALLHTEREITEVTRGVGGDKTDDLVSQLIRRQLSLS